MSPGPGVSPTGSPLVAGGFVAIPLVLATALVLGTGVAGRRTGEAPHAIWRWVSGVAAGAVAWLALTWTIAAAGVLARWDAKPPPSAFFLLAVVGLGVVIACSRLGTRLVRGLPLSVLVGAQAFRFPLELLMHRAYEEGLMPVQMSYAGRNLDILSGISAALLGLALSRWAVPRIVVALWNVAGLALLANVVIVAVVSTPILGWFGEDRLNTWVAGPPYVWLPAVMVLAAWAGHLLVFRKLGRGNA